MRFFRRDLHQLFLMSFRTPIRFQNDDDGLLSTGQSDRMTSKERGLTVFREGSALLEKWENNPERNTKQRRQAGPAPAKRAQSHTRRLAWALFVLSIASLNSSLVAQQATTILSENVELARLVDLCAQRLKINIQYDESTLSGRVTLRLGRGVADEELWALTNRLLATRGLTSVQMPGEETVSIVQLQEAAGLARVEDDLNRAQAGFVKVVREIVHRPIEEVQKPVEAFLSRVGGKVTRIGSTSMMMVSDLRPHVEQVLTVAAELDVPVSEAIVMERIPSTHVEASSLINLIERVVTARSSVSGETRKGKLIAAPDGRSLLLFAPETERQFWRSLALELDKHEHLKTVSYSPSFFAVEDVADLVRQVLGGAATETAGWRMVTDDLTGTLIVTATETQHEQVAQLLERLEAVQPETRRPIRSYKIRNRNPSEVVELLQRLVGVGAVASPSEGLTLGQNRQNRRRNVLPVDPDDLVRSEMSSPAESPQGRLPAPGEASKNLLNEDLQGGIDLVITSDEVTNSIIAVGEPKLLSQLEEIIKDLDCRQPQVMLEVLLVTLTESDMLDLGVELQRLTTADDAFAQLTSLFGIGSPALSTTPPLPTATGATGVVLDPGEFSVLVQALEVLNEGRSITVPRVLVNNNEQAQLDSVLQNPFTSTNASDTVATTSFGGTLDAGTTVSVRPQISEGDHLLLEYNVSISRFTGDSADPSLPPPRQQNNLQSVVTIPDGFTVALGGLEIESDDSAVSQVPLLGSIPLIGEVFRSRSRTVIRSRFFVFLRANILRNATFSDLKYMSRVKREDAELEDSWPSVQPRLIR